MTLLEKLNIVKNELRQLNNWLESLCLCQYNDSDIVFGTQLGAITQQLKDLSYDYLKSANEFGIDKSISMPIYDNIQAAIRTIKNNSGNETKKLYYCFCIGRAHNYISVSIIGLDDWIVSIELS